MIVVEEVLKCRMAIIDYKKKKKKKNDNLHNSVINWFCLPYD